MLLREFDSTTAIKKRNYQERIITPKEVEPSSKKEISKGLVRKTMNFETYLLGLQKIKNQMALAFGDLSAIKSVAYPFSGFDAATPVTLFPEATEYFSFDNHPFLPEEFLNSRKTIFTVEPKMEVGGFTNVETLNEEEYLAPQIIGALKKSVPNFRLKQIRVFKINGSKTSGVIYFESGAGTLKKYVQLHDDLRSSQSWFQAFATFHPQAIIVKASMFSKTKEFQESVVETLKSSQGVLVEDSDYGIGDLTSFTPTKALKSVVLGPEAILYDGDTLGLYDVRFGYEDRVYIRYYKNFKKPL